VRERERKVKRKRKSQRIGGSASVPLRKGGSVSARAAVFMSLPPGRTPNSRTNPSPTPP
jgi:hypothetical protein